MIEAIGLILACAALSTLAPRFAAGLAIVLALAVVFPLVTGIFGMFAWAISHCTSHVLSLHDAFLYIGLPSGILVTLFVLA
jgi:hypothetical protein